MDDSTVPLSLGFVKECEKQPMEIEGGGSGSAETLGPSRGKKRPPSPRGEKVEDSSRSTTMDTDDEWFDSGSEEEEEEEDDDGSQGMYPPLTLEKFPRASCDHDKQTELLYANPLTKLHGPTPTRLFPAFKTGKHHLFVSDYNLHDKSEITVSNAGDCLNGCQCIPMVLLQFIDAKIAGYEHNRPGRAKIFGFVAARDTVNPLRNYVYKRDIDNCEAVSVKRKTGVARLSLISPTRVIQFSYRVLIEFELHAATEDKANGDDGPIIEGCTELYSIFESKSFVEHQRVYSERCALDIKYIVLMNAVEARIEVKVLRLGAIDGGFNMRLLAKTSSFSEVIRLFRGAAPKLGVMMSFAIAVKRHSFFDLYIEGYPGEDPSIGQKVVPTNAWWKSSFASSYHRTDEVVAELGDFASVSVKVTWKSYRKLTSRGVVPSLKF